MLIKKEEICYIDNLKIVEIRTQASNINKHAKRKLNIYQTNKRIFKRICEVYVYTISKKKKKLKKIKISK